MRRFLHALGRWRGTHCNTCGRPVTDTRTYLAAVTGNRLTHLFDCSKGGQR